MIAAIKSFIDDIVDSGPWGIAAFSAGSVICVIFFAALIYAAFE